MWKSIELLPILGIIAYKYKSIISIIKSEIYKLYWARGFYNTSTSQLS